VSTPYGDCSTHGFERLSPRQYVPVDAVNQRAIEIEQEALLPRGLSARGSIAALLLMLKTRRFA
jgi:hypothetical protein